MYSNLDDLEATLYDNSNNESKDISFISKTHLVDLNQNMPPIGQIKSNIIYTFDSVGIRLECSLPKKAIEAGARFVLPVIAKREWQEQLNEKILTVKTNNATLSISANNNIIIPKTTDKRVFNPIPGFCFIPVYFYPDKDGSVTINIKME